MNLNAKAKENIRLAREWMEENGVPVVIEGMGNGHPCFVLRHNGKTARQKFAGSPSIWSGHKVLKGVKRTLKSLGWTPPPTPSKPKPQPQETDVTKLVQTGRGSMFDAQRPTTGPASDPIVWRPGDPSLTGEIEVGGISVPTITEAARAEGGNRGRPSPEYKAYLDRTCEWADKIVDRIGSSQKNWQDMAAALELSGHKVTADALVQRWRVWKQKRGEYQRKHASPVKKVEVSDPAALINHMRTPIHIPEAARRSYGFGEQPGDVRRWAIDVRGPWINKAMDLGATAEQVAEALSKMGHPVKADAVRVVRRRVMQERAEEAAVEAEREQKKAARDERKAERESPIVQKVDPEVRRSRGAATGDLVSQIASLVEAEVQRRLDGLDIAELKRDAAKWRAHVEYQAAKKRLKAALGDDDD